MGCWIGASGRLTVQPEPDEQLIKEYVYFSNHTCPEVYCEDEIILNSWFFDSENRLISGIGKFAEPSVWYKHLNEFFFKPMGYRLCGDPGFVGEFDLDLWKLGEQRETERKLWDQRIRDLFKNEE